MDVSGTWMRSSPRRRADATASRYPVTPILTVLICAYIMSGLAAITWVIFLTWIAIALLYYFAIGRRHAKLNSYTSPEEIAEPLGKLDDE